MMNRKLLLGWIWALQLILAHADDITNREQIITVVSTQVFYPLVPSSHSICHHLHLQFLLRFG